MTFIPPIKVTVDASSLSSPPHDRASILDTAKQYVTADRNTSYGEPEDSFSLIADLWSAYFEGRSDAHRLDNFDPYDVAMMLALLKVARAAQRPIDPDSLIDLAGYAACAGEILEGLAKPPQAAAMEDPPAPQPAPTTARPETRFDDL